MVRLAFRQAVNRPCGVVLNLDAEPVREMLEAIRATAQDFELLLTPVVLRPGHSEPVLFITSGADGAHSGTSRHYRDEAIDVGLSNFTSRQAKRDFRAALARRFGSRYTVLLENEGASGEHVHVQVPKGTVFTPAAPAPSTADRRSSPAPPALRSRPT